jgi:hypothetical protein
MYPFRTLYGVGVKENEKSKRRTRNGSDNFLHQVDFLASGSVASGQPALAGVATG